MYLVSLVTVMCSSSFSLQYFATRQKDTFSSLESKHSNFLTWPRQRPSPSYLNRFIWRVSSLEVGTSVQYGHCQCKLVVIRRSLKLCNPSVKESTYFVFVGPSLKYAFVAWAAWPPLIPRCRGWSRCRGTQQDSFATATTIRMLVHLNSLLSLVCMGSTRS